MPIAVEPKIPQTTVGPPNPLEEQEALSYVFSFKGRTGDVLPAASDYSASFIGNDSSVSGGNVSAALDELESQIDGLGFIYQPLDTGLTSISGLTTAADKMIYTTALDVYTTTDLTSYARTLLDDTDAATARGTLDATGGRSALTQNYIPKVDANGDLINSSVTDDGSTVTFSGNVTINGTTTIVDSTVVAIGDSLMKYAKDNTASDVIDIGWYGVYGSGGAKYSGVFRDASDGKFRFYSGLEVEPTTTVDTGAAGYTQATIIAAIESNSVAITGGTIDGCSYNTLQMDTAYGTPSHSEGLVFYDNVNKCLAYYNDVPGSTLQIGQELWVRVKNTSGADITNGQVVYLNGQDSGVPTVALAAADLFSTAVPTLGFATHLIANGAIGLITAFGTVRDIDTSLCTAGDTLYLSETPGDYTIVAPNSPSYKVVLGSCTLSDASNGTALVDINPLSNTDTVINFWNGSILEDHGITVISDGVTVSCTLEKSGGGDLNLFFNGGFTSFDATPTASVNLSAGSDTIPTLNYVYIPESTGLLTASTSSFPATQHVPVATILCQSAATVQTEGAYKVHAWTDHISTSNDQGHLSDINRWIRNQNATWLSGIVPTFSGTGTGTVGLSSTSGVILQLHEHAFPTFTDPANIFVVNDSVAAYTEITNIHDIDTDSLGATLNNSTFGLVIWGCVSEDTGDCKFYANLPSGGYGSGKPDLVRADADKYQDFSIPTEFKGTGFLVYRLVISRNAGGTASTLYTGGSGDDLRGSTPGSGAGGSSAGIAITEFADSQFDIYNITDNTKQINFSAASITTGNTRTITMPDADVTLMQGATNLTTQYRGVFVNAAGEVTESSSIVTDADGHLTIDGVTIRGGNNNVFMGSATGDLVTGGSNTAVGNFAMASASSGTANSAFGYVALNAVTGSNNTAFGNSSLRSLTSGSTNSAFGLQAGRYISGGSTAHTTGMNSVFFGANSYPLADGQTNQIVIGYNATGAGSNTVTLGNDSIVSTLLKGNVLIGTTTAGASKLVVNDDSIQINTSKTPASATATGTQGQVAWDSSYVYVCTATDTWKRAALSTWT